MIVFMLSFSDGQGTGIAGIYSTPELAEQARDRYPFENVRTEIIPMTIDYDYWQLAKNARITSLGIEPV